MTHSLYTLDDRNGQQLGQRIYRITIAHYDDVSKRDAARRRGSRGSFTTHAAAVQGIRERLENEKERLTARLAHIEADLAAIDGAYVEPQRHAEAIAARRDELVQALGKLRATPGQARVGALGINNAYCNAGAELFVFNLPEYTDVDEVFEPALDALILDALAECGATVIDKWNGSECSANTFSVRVQPQAIAQGTSDLAQAH